MGEAFFFQVIPYCRQAVRGAGSLGVQGREIGGAIERLIIFMHAERCPEGIGKGYIHAQILSPELARSYGDSAHRAVANSHVAMVIHLQGLATGYGVCLSGIIFSYQRELWAQIILHSSEYSLEDRVGL